MDRRRRLDRKAGLMSFLGKLFGTDKAAASLIDNVSNGLDKLVYTSEEKAEDAAKARSEGYQVYMEWLKSTSGSRVARRLIALIVTGIWAVQHILGQCFALTAVFMDDIVMVEKFTQSSDMLFEHAQENNALVGVVLLFYFGGPAAIDASKGLIQRWVK